MKKLIAKKLEEFDKVFYEGKGSGIAVWIDTESKRATKYGHLAGLNRWLSEALEEAYGEGVKATGKLSYLNDIK